MEDTTVFKYLCDSGAEISIVKEEVIGNQIVRQKEKIEINGVGGERILTKGSIFLQLQIGADETLRQIFHIVDDKVNLEGVEGILGLDFMTGNKIEFCYGVESSVMKTRNYEVQLKREIGESNNLLKLKKKKVKVPGRSSKTVQVSTTSVGTGIVESMEIGDGVFMAGQLVNPEQGSVWINILNTKESEIEIDSPHP